MASYDVVVIGAGMGGLAAANLLAAKGKSVLVVDALSEAGGKMGRAQHEGVYFDTGPSVLTLPEILDDIFKAAGTSVADELELLKGDHVFEYLFANGTTVPVHFDLNDTLQAVRETLSETAAEDLKRFLDYAKNIWDVAAPHFVYGPAPTIGSAFKLGMAKWRDLRKVDPMRSMKAAIDAHVKSEYVRDILLRYATYNGSDPRRAPATLNCIAWVEMGAGCYGVNGGMHQVAQAMERVAARNGAEFRYDSTVARILTANGRVSGVQIGDEAIACDAVVSNADVAHLVNDLAPQVSSVSAPKEPSMSGWTAVVKARRIDRPAHQVLFPEHDYLNEFSDIFDHDRPPTSPTVYVCAQEKAHGREGWDEHEPVFIMANAPAEPANGARNADIWGELESKVMTRLRERGLLAADDEIVWRRTPGKLAATFPGSRGSIYGAASNNQFAAFQRAPNAVKDLPGLYIATGSAHPGGGVPLCMLSGRAAVEAMDG